MTLSNSKHIFILKNICHPRQTLFGLLLTILLVGALASPVLAGDLEKGEKTFIKCKVCHTVEKDVSKIGPSLYGVFGRKSGSLESFPNYSDSMKSADIIWDDKAIREFLKAPRTYIANTKMIFIGIKNDEEIDNLLAYLRSVSGAEAAAETARMPRLLLRPQVPRLLLRLRVPKLLLRLRAPRLLLRLRVPKLLLRLRMPKPSQSSFAI